jgi:hypothetical protein
MLWAKKTITDQRLSKTQNAVIGRFVKQSASAVPMFIKHPVVSYLNLIQKLAIK